jgi:hypothetical protein
LLFPSSEEILLLPVVFLVWNKCFLCRTEKKGEDLKFPPTHYSFIKNYDGYYMIATNIPLFQGINQLPIILDPIILDEGGGIEEILRRNNAKHHQNCRLLFNNTMLERTRKTAACSNISSVLERWEYLLHSCSSHHCS